MTDLRDFLNWFDGFAENIDKTPNAKQWAKIKERVTALRSAAATSVPEKPAAAPAPFRPAKPKPQPKPAFYIDMDNLAKKASGDRILASDVQGTLVDLRGMDGDMKTIVWADESTGLNGRDLTIVAG